MSLRILVWKPDLLTLIAPLLVAIAVGCKGEAAYNTDRVAAVGLAAEGRHPEAVKLMAPHASRASDPDHALNNLVLARSAMAAGDSATAEAAFLRANRTIDAAATSSARGGQRNATWKGDAHEQVMAAFYQGVHYLTQSDFDNARGSFERAESRLKQLTQEGDIEPAQLPFLTALLARTWEELGDASMADRVRERLPDGCRDLAADGNIILVVDVGAGPRRGIYYENNFVEWGQSAPDVNDRGKWFRGYMPAGPAVEEIEVRVNGKDASDAAAARSSLLGQGNLVAVARHRQAVREQRTEGKGGFDQIGASMVQGMRNLFGGGQVGKATGDVLEDLEHAREDREWRLPWAVRLVTLDLPAGTHDIEVSTTGINEYGAPAISPVVARQVVGVPSESEAMTVAYFACDSLGINARRAGPLGVPVLDPRESVARYDGGASATATIWHARAMDAFAAQAADGADAVPVRVAVINALDTPVRVSVNEMGRKARIPFTSRQRIAAANERVIAQERVGEKQVQQRVRRTNGYGEFELHGQQTNLLVVDAGEAGKIELEVWPTITAADRGGKIDTVLVQKDGVRFDFLDPAEVEDLKVGEYTQSVYGLRTNVRVGLGGD